jgi:hypothetical protein
MTEKFEKYKRNLPKPFKVGQNPVITALIEAFAETDTETSQQIENTKAQLFVRTAEGQYLDRLASSLGVSRPVSLGLLDSEYQELVPNLSLKAKQVRKTFYDTADVFWGPLFSRANVTTTNFEPFLISVGEYLLVSVDNGPIQKIKVLSNDLQTNGTASAEELSNILQRIKGVAPQILTDALTGNKQLNLRTNTPGAIGNIEIYSGSTILGTSKIDLVAKKYETNQLNQRVTIYEIRPNEVVIEIPAVVPKLRRSLKGSHHFHEDSTLEESWVGSFFYNPSGSQASYTVSRQKAVIQENLAKGNVFTKVTVDDTSSFGTSTGTLIFDWGGPNEEVGIKFRGIPNSNTVLLDPSYKFRFDHVSGETINALVSQTPYIPRRSGDDYAIYLTSPSDARVVVQEILKSLAAAGIIINFVILAPSYKYAIDNPYLTSDDAPSS